MVYGHFLSKCLIPLCFPAKTELNLTVSFKSHVVVDAPMVTFRLFVLEIGVSLTIDNCNREAHHFHQNICFQVETVYLAIERAADPSFFNASFVRVRQNRFNGGCWDLRG